MRGFRLSMIALAVAGLAYSGSAAVADPCAIGLNVHNHAWIVSKHKKVAQCLAGAAGCKCVSCYDLTGKVWSACFPLVASAK